MVGFLQQGMAGSAVGKTQRKMQTKEVVMQQVKQAAGTGRQQYDLQTICSITLPCTPGQ
jgi:hypothetical protein